MFSKIKKNIMWRLTWCDIVNFTGPNTTRTTAKKYSMTKKNQDDIFLNYYFLDDNILDLLGFTWIDLDLLGSTHINLSNLQSKSWDLDNPIESKKINKLLSSILN
jgi:hypothetical protein